MFSRKRGESRRGSDKVVSCNSDGSHWGSPTSHPDCALTSVLSVGYQIKTSSKVRIPFDSKGKGPFQILAGKLKKHFKKNALLLFLSLKLWERARKIQRIITTDREGNVCKAERISSFWRLLFDILRTQPVRVFQKKKKTFNSTKKNIREKKSSWKPLNLLKYWTVKVNGPFWCRSISNSPGLQCTQRPSCTSFFPNSIPSWWFYGSSPSKQKIKHVRKSLPIFFFSHRTVNPIPTEYKICKDVFNKLKRYYI